MTTTPFVVPAPTTWLPTLALRGLAVLLLGTAIVMTFVATVSGSGMAMATAGLTAIVGSIMLAADVWQMADRA